MKPLGYVIAAWTALLLTAGAVEASAHIEAGVKFLTAWGKGDWEGLATVAGEKVTVSVGGKESVIDVTGKKAEAMLVFPFKGLSAVRVEGKVKGVTVDDIAVKVGGEEKKGKGTLTLEEKNGKVMVTKVAVE
jgi:hypothetical protein